MVKTNIEWLAMSDNSIISVIGEYIKQKRLIQNKTQATIAEAAGINRWTLSKIENGEPISLMSLIQILRALDLLEILNIFETQTQTQISPLELAKLEKQKRKRASSEGSIDNQNKSEW
tara:strand:+ start:1354 stop:1707 length:354 start_codon:yes stop_codon:yes gene_type:complete